MKINWFTVIAQVINFLILVWLLKRFLYKPVLNAIDEREKKIVSRLEDAKTKKAEAKKEQDEFNEKNEQFDNDKKRLMDKAIAEANTKRDELLENARKEAVVLASKQKKALDDMRDGLNKEITQKTQQAVFDISRKALADIASASLEELSAKMFINQLEELKAEGKQQLIDAFKSGTGRVLVQSAFELPKKQQTEIKKTVDDILGKETEFEFQSKPAIISGIELTTNGYKLAWSIAAYLASFEKSISETLEEKTKTEAEKKKEPEEKSEPKHKAESEKKVDSKKKAEPEDYAKPEKKPDPAIKSGKEKEITPEMK